MHDIDKPNNLHWNTACMLHDTLVDILNAVGSLLVFVVMLYLTADISGRIFFNAPLAGVPELSSMAIVSIVFLQVPHAIRSGSLIRSTMLFNGIAKRSPKTGLALSTVFDLVGFSVFLIITFGSWPSFSRAFLNGDQYGTPGVFQFPQWPVRLLVIVCCTIAAYQMLFAAIGHALEIFRRPGNSPAKSNGRSKTSIKALMENGL